MAIGALRGTLTGRTQPVESQVTHHGLILTLGRTQNLALTLHREKSSLGSQQGVR